MLEPIPLSAIRTIASMRLHIHCGVRWSIGAQVMRVIEYAHFALNKFESVSITHLQPKTQSLHKFPSQPQCALSIATFIGNVLEHQESLLTHVYHVKCNILGLMGHIWPPKTIIESFYLWHTHTHHIIWLANLASLILLYQCQCIEHAYFIV